MARKPAKPKAPLAVEALKPDDAKRKNIPAAEHQPVLDEQTKRPLRVAYERRNRDLDPQLVWRDKDEQDWSDLVVHAPPLYIQELICSATGTPSSRHDRTKARESSRQSASSKSTARK